MTSAFPNTTARGEQTAGTGVMGIINVTPDSFFPGSRVLGVAEALAFGEQMIADGAVVLDVGGESTRPGADPVDIDTELERVIPTIEGLLAPAEAAGVRISIDTRNAHTARVAVAAGAHIINDISAQLAPVAAETGAAWIAMHMQGVPLNMQDAPTYDDVVGEVLQHLVDVATQAEAMGVREVLIDPGIGFGKNDDHNMALIAALDRFVATRWPVVLGVSRKGFIGRTHSRSDAGADADPEELAFVGAADRLEGSLALATWGATAGVSLIRVHDVLPTVQATQVVGTATINQKAHAA